jgi:hypothetical protein
MTSSRLLNVAVTLLGSTLAGSMLFGDEQSKTEILNQLRLDAAQLALVENAIEAQEKAESKKNFLGVDFGLGLSLTFDRSRIKEAEVVNGVVRVREEERYIPRVNLETHYFFPMGKQDSGVCSENRCGIGPFLGVLASKDDVVDAVSFGLATGFRKDAKQSESFNFGIGIVWDRKVKELGDGIRENEPLPAGETQVRFKERGDAGYVLLFSFSF